MIDLHNIQLDGLVLNALQEDWGYGDLTTDGCVKRDTYIKANLIAKEEFWVSGLDVASYVFTKVDPLLEVKVHVGNGELVKPKDCLLEVKGNARSILKAERVALNFLGKMSGIATLTREYVSQLEGTSAKLLDTRKTTPGLRILEKLAVAAGGGSNHRFCLSDGVMVKENHIRSCGGITEAVEKLRKTIPTTVKIEVETTCEEEVEEALSAGADIIMLDNMSPERMKAIVEKAKGKAKFEASGNVRLNNLRKIAETGVDYISTSGIVTRAQWVDISLLFVQEQNEE